MSIWAFIPDFFVLYQSTSDELDELHRELLSADDADPDLQADVRAVLKLPGVKKLTSGKRVRALLNELVALANELWPDEKRRLISPEATRAQLNEEGRARSKAMFATPNDATLEEIGQDFETTRERIRQIEEKALRRLRETRKGSAYLNGGDDA